METKEKKFPHVINHAPGSEKYNRKSLEGMKNQLQELIDAWHNLKVGPVPGNDLQRVIRDPDSVVKKAMIAELQAEIPRGTRFPLDEKKYLESFVGPDTTQLKAATSALQYSDALVFFYYDGKTLHEKTEACQRYVYKDSFVIWSEEEAYLYETLETIAYSLNLLGCPENIKVKELLRFDSGDRVKWKLCQVKFRKLKGLLDGLTRFKLDANFYQIPEMEEAEETEETEEAANN